ncbi:peptidase [Bacteroides reticulotermitis JCM 10512]|uniref:Peptidase n=1 Tax=Bacteroides reticulotermitis JCM 10512 TaxID=1445607 RepID=W4UNQ4_9BACE|nr:peptidase [Bacteroides reticulotermitis JCM 10512]
MNFNCIIKTGLVAVATMISLSSFSQDLIARQAPIDKKLKTVDSLALQKQIRAEQAEYPALSFIQTGIISMYMLTGKMQLFLKVMQLI